MAMAVFRLPQTSGVGRFAARDARGEPHPLRRLQREGAEALTALVHKLSVFFDSRACIEHSRMAMCGGNTHLMGALPGGARAAHLVSSPSENPSQQPRTHH